MQSRYAITLVCFFAILLCHRLGVSGIHPSWSDAGILSIDKDLSQAISVPNKWGYIVWEAPGVSDEGLTFSLGANIFVRGVRTISIEEATALLCNLYPSFLDKLNAVRSMRPLLASFPLDPDSCELSLGFVDEHDEAVRPPLLAGVSLDRGEISFYRRNTHRKDGDGPYQTVATRKANDIPGLKRLYQPKCPRSKPSTTPMNFRFSRDHWKYNNPLSQEQICELKDLCSKTLLAITAVGTVGKTYFDSRPFDFALRGTQRLNLKESRDLVSTCLQHTLEYIKNSQQHKELIKKWSSERRNYRPGLDPASDQIAFRINFWDENIDRPVAPYIAEIRLLDDKLSYFTADENQCLVLVFEETVKDNLQRISQDDSLSQGGRQ